VRFFSLALATAPAHAEALYLRGTGFYHLGRYAAALADLTRAADLDPAQARYLSQKAHAHWMLRQTDLAVAAARAAARLDPWMPAAHELLSTLEMPGPNYLVVLALIHEILRPDTYIEIGVSRGASLRQVRPWTTALGVDPDPQLPGPAAPNQRIFPMTSDEFFARHDVRQELGGRPLQLAFIDGMHHFEYALRDFMNLEPYCTPESVVLVHDCCPLDAETARRERATEFWSGDIWRLILALKKYRPDLAVAVIATLPTGLAVIRNLDPASRVIHDRLDRICEEFLAVEFDVLEGRKAQMLNLVPNDLDHILALFPGAGHRRPDA
jgi:tetratricopeptide (TPR) repeat protein